jgi:hypothetical protein
VDLLLDECIDRRLGRELIGHSVRATTQMGWAGLKNGALLTVAQKEFDVFITVDRNLSHQQNITKYDIALIVLRAKTNQVEDLRPLVPSILHTLERIKPKQTVILGI